MPVEKSRVEASARLQVGPPSIDRTAAWTWVAIGAGTSLFWGILIYWLVHR